MTDFSEGSQQLLETRLIEYLVDKLMGAQYCEVFGDKVELEDRAILSSKTAVGCGFGSDVDVRYVSQHPE